MYNYVHACTNGKIAYIVLILFVYMRVYVTSSVNFVFCFGERAV